MPNFVYDVTVIIVLFYKKIDYLSLIINLLKRYINATMSSDRKANLKIDRLIKGCYNYFNNPLSHAVSLRNTLNEIKEYNISLKEDFINLYKSGLEKKRPDLILALFGKSTKNEFDEELSFERMINKLFVFICYNRSAYLKKFISYPWVRYDISPYEMYEILTHRVSNGLLTHNPSLLTPNDSRKYYINLNFRFDRK
jgi:hypothetical protein